MTEAPTLLAKSTQPTVSRCKSDNELLAKFDIQGNLTRDQDNGMKIRNLSTAHVLLYGYYHFITDILQFSTTNVAPLCEQCPFS